MARDPRELAEAWTAHQRHERTAPSAELAPFVECFWTAAWDYDTAYRQLVVPYPNVHLTFRDGRAVLNGVRTGHHVKVLEGRGRVLGVAFRPGCFRPFVRSPVSALTDRELDAAAVFAGPPAGVAEVAEAEEFLRGLRPEPDAMAEWAAANVAAVAADRTITTVGGLAERSGVTVRTLQRRYAEYVGVTPKWVIRRYRLHEVTERLARSGPVDWPGLAADLGYADQAHLSRDFKKIFGEPPTRYAARYPG